MHTYQGKPVKFMRKAEAKDSGFDAKKDQLWITLEDGTSKMVLASEVSLDQSLLSKEPGSTGPTGPGLTNKGVPGVPRDATGLTPVGATGPGPSMGSYQGRNIKALRPAVAADSGFDPTVPQSLITFDDGKTQVVPANTVILPPYNPAQPTHVPVMAGKPDHISTLNTIIDQLVHMRNRMTGHV